MSTRFSDIRIRWKVLIAPSVLICVLASLALYASHILRANQATLVNLAEGPMRQADAVARFATAIWTTQSQLR